MGFGLTVVESCTGGLISSRLTDIPGSSAYTFINLVTYGNMEKTQYLGVKPETITQYGAVSPQVATEMAEGAQRNTGQDWALSITGIAGPEGGSDEKPVGLAYIGITGPEPKNAKANHTLIKKVLVNPRYSRADIKYWFSQYALSFLLQALNGSLRTDLEPSVAQPGRA